MSDNSQVARRSFLSRFGIGAAALGASSAVALPARAQNANGFRPQRHAADDWLDAPKGGHRLVIDSSSPDGGGSALLYAGNFFAANKAGYNLDPPAIAVVVVFRHLSTPFGYTDAMWAKYGEAFSEIANFKDPKSKAAPTAKASIAAKSGSVTGLRCASLKAARVFDVSTVMLMGSVSKESDASRRCIKPLPKRQVGIAAGAGPRRQCELSRFPPGSDCDAPF